MLVFCFVFLKTFEGGGIGAQKVDVSWDTSSHHNWAGNASYPHWVGMPRFFRQQVKTRWIRLDGYPVWSEDSLDFDITSTCCLFCYAAACIYVLWATAISDHGTQTQLSVGLRVTALRPSQGFWGTFYFSWTGGGGKAKFLGKQGNRDNIGKTNFRRSPSGEKYWYAHLYCNDFSFDKNGYHIFTIKTFFLHM